LISPFVGRIYDWHKKTQGSAWDEAAHRGLMDPGVRSVIEIFQYFKRFGIETQVMGASFRNTDQIMALAGCDLLTISPELLADLAARPATGVSPSLSAQSARDLLLSPILYSESSFRLALNADACATEKLAEGIRAFAADTERLEVLMRVAT
jgi:transaldolase